MTFQNITKLISKFCLSNHKHRVNMYHKIILHTTFSMSLLVCYISSIVLLKNFFYLHSQAAHLHMTHDPATEQSNCKYNFIEKCRYCVNINDTKISYIQVNSKQRNSILIAVLHLKFTVRPSTGVKTRSSMKIYNFAVFSFDFFMKCTIPIFSLLNLIIVTTYQCYKLFMISN